jgi:hypothetical protein
VERKSLFSVFDLAIRAMTAALATTGAPALQKFGGKYPLIVFDVVVESLDKLGLKLGHGASLAKMTGAQPEGNVSFGHVPNDGGI